MGMGGGHLLASGSRAALWTGSSEHSVSHGKGGEVGLVIPHREPPTSVGDPCELHLSDWGGGTITGLAPHSRGQRGPVLRTEHGDGRGASNWPHAPWPRSGRVRWHTAQLRPLGAPTRWLWSCLRDKHLALFKPGWVLLAAPLGPVGGDLRDPNGRTLGRDGGLAVAKYGPIQLTMGPLSGQSRGCD